MNEKGFIDALSAKTGIDDKRISKLMSSVADIVSSNLQEGKDVTIQGFGVFETKKKMEKIEVNASTGKRILFPPKLLVGFRPSSLLKERINSVLNG